MKFRAFSWVCENCGHKIHDKWFGLRFEEPRFSCPICGHTTDNKYAYSFYRISRAIFCSLSLSVLLAAIWSISANLRPLQGTSISDMLEAIAIVFLLIFGVLAYDKKLAFRLTRKISPVVMEIMRVFCYVWVAGVLFVMIYVVLHTLGIKVYDEWLLAGLSLSIFVSHLFFGSPYIQPFILNKLHIRITAMILFFLMMLGLSFAIVFLAVTLLAEFSLYEANPLLDMAVALLIPAIISIAFVSTRKEQNPSHKGVS